MTDVTAEQATTTMTAKDMFKTVTGYDEIAVSQQFGDNLAALRDNPFNFMRALIFIHLRRRTDNDYNDAQAHAAILDLTLGEVESYFAAAPDAVELGKGEPAS